MDGERLVNIDLGTSEPKSFLCKGLNTWSQFGSPFAVPAAMRTSTPTPDRRQRRRIMTLRNFRNVLLVALALFAVITVRSEMRDRTSDGDYGRLARRSIARAPEVAPRPVPVAEASPVPEAASADPFLIQAAAREQYLRSDLAPLSPTTPAVAEGQANAAPATRASSGQEHVAVVGGPEGVTPMKTEERRPVLGGGFGRQ